MGNLENWGVTSDDLDAALVDGPRPPRVLVGFLSGRKLQQTVFADSRIRRLVRYDDHDKMRPADFSFDFQRETINVEVKSLQSRSVRADNGRFTGRCQVSARDRRTVAFPDGSTLATTCLLAGKFDILAVNLFEFGQQWRFGFIRNQDLPRSRHKAYTPYQQQHLLATSVPVTWPLTPPFREAPFELLREIVRERRT